MYYKITRNYLNPYMKFIKSVNNPITVFLVLNNFDLSDTQENTTYLFPFSIHQNANEYRTKSQRGGKDQLNNVPYRSYIDDLR